MASKLDFDTLTHESRPQVYLLWAVLTGIGFTTTHYYQNPNINGVWLVLAVVGLGFMNTVMPLRVHQMRNIFLSWLIPITAGLLVSAMAVHTDFITGIIPYLGAFWLFVLSFGYFWNGMFDPPSTWYFIAAAVNIVAAALCYLVEPFTDGQYLIAAIVSVWSMLLLWIFRS